jgi:hypothetical protein
MDSFDQMWQDAKSQASLNYTTDWDKPQKVHLAGNILQARVQYEQLQIQKQLLEQNVLLEQLRIMLLDIQSKQVK